MLNNLVLCLSKHALMRSIVHLDLDSFFVSVERLRNTALVGQPLIIGGSGNRGVVASCSYETRYFGVHSAMPIKLAKRLCPQAIILRGDMDAYSKYSKLVTEVIRDQSPLYEKTSIDEFYVDLTGMDRFFGCFQWSKELRQRITRETGLPVSFGLSVNKLVSKVGTGEAKPDGQIEVPRGMEKQFLAPLSVSKIPMIGDKTYRKLCNMGVRKVSTLSAIPARLLEREFGKSGISLWQKANAIDDSPVVPYSESKSISTEQTFSEDTTDIIRLRALLVTMTERLGFELRSSQRLTSCVTVKVRYSDFNTHTQQRQVYYSSNDDVLIKYVQELFDKLYSRRVLIRLIGVKFSSLVHGNHQIDLFSDTNKMINLYQAMDKMKIKYGPGSVKRAVGIKQ